MIPVRVLGNSLGFSVEWNETERSVTLNKDNKQIVFQLDKSEAIIDGKMVQLQTAPYLYHEKTFVPLREVAEAFGFTVNWKAEWNMVFLS